MLLDGVEVRTDPSLDVLRSRWSKIRDAGPQLTSHELNIRRYLVTDVLDDLHDVKDPAEQLVIAALLFERIAQLMLLRDRRWIATGKHLPRALRAMDAVRADALLTPWLAADFAMFADAVTTELDRAGGRLQDGFTR